MSSPSRVPLVFLSLSAVGLTLAALELLSRAAVGFGIIELREAPSIREVWAEKGLRVDRDLKFANRRNATFRVAGITFETNSLGLRSHEVEQTKPPGTYRILALGDSTVFGWAVPAQATFCHLLARILNRRQGALDVEVVNAGVPGYSLFQAWTYLEREGIRLDPDLLIVLSNFNDRRAALGLASRDSALAHGVFYYRLRLRETLSASVASRILRALMGSRTPVASGAPRRISLAGLEARVEPDRYAALLEELLDFARVRGIEVVLVPHRDNPRLTHEIDQADFLAEHGEPERALESLRAGLVSSEFYRLAFALRINQLLDTQESSEERLDSVSIRTEWINWDGSVPLYVSTRYDEIMAEQAHREGVAVVGLGARALGEPSVYLDQIHLNRLGHRELAERLARAIRARIHLSGDRPGRSDSSSPALHAVPLVGY